MCVINLPRKMLYKEGEGDGSVCFAFVCIKETFRQGVVHLLTKAPQRRSTKTNSSRRLFSSAFPYRGNKLQEGGKHWVKEPVINFNHGEQLDKNTMKQDETSTILRNFFSIVYEFEKEVKQEIYLSGIFCGGIVYSLEIVPCWRRFRPPRTL